MNRRLLAVAAFLLPAAIVGYFLVPSDSGLANRAQFNRTHSAYTPETVGTFSEFPIYHVGADFEGLPIRAILRRDSSHEVVPQLRAKKDYVSFIYGECVIAVGAQGCAPPLEVQIWPACTRSLSSYTLTPNGEPLPHRTLSIRGVPGAAFEDGGRLELYSGNVTIVIFGNDEHQIQRAARALRRANPPAGVTVSTAADLPSPAAGALEGNLKC